MPAAQARKPGGQQQSDQQQRDARFHDKQAPGADNADIDFDGSNDMQKLLIIAFLAVILWNLGAGLYYMMVDKGTTDRTVRSLSWRIGISVLLIALVALGIFTGVIKPHGIYH